MPRSRLMSPGAGGSNWGVNRLGNQGGGNKKQGLIGTTNMRVGLVPYVRTRADGGNSRHWTFCMNQLGGVGRRWGQAAGPGNRGGVHAMCKMHAHRSRQRHPRRLKQSSGYGTPHVFRTDPGPQDPPRTPCPAPPRGCFPGTECRDGFCEPCEPGSFSPGGTGPCQPCASGTYASEARALYCAGDACAPGSYGPGGQTSEAGATCTACPAGQHQEDEGQTSCDDCEPGSWSPAGSPFCHMCQQGATPRGDSCAWCPADYSTDGPGSAVCETCWAAPPPYCPTGPGTCSFCAKDGSPACAAWTPGTSMDTAQTCVP